MNTEYDLVEAKTYAAFWEQNPSAEWVTRIDSTMYAIFSDYNTFISYLGEKNK